MKHDRCLACGEAAAEERIEALLVEHNGRTTEIQDRRMVCGVCSNVSYSGKQISEHEIAVGAAIRKLDGLLTADELHRIRSKYRLKQTDMEQMLATGPKTWTRWERGKIPQSKPTDKLIRAIAEDPDLARELMRQAGVVNPEAEATFDQIDRDAKQIAGAMLRAELGDLTDQVIEKAYKSVRDARRRVASQAEAA